MQLREDGIPRRCDVLLQTPAERAIAAAVAAVEAAGVHPLLTDAVVLLSNAKDKVADFVELDASGMTCCGDKPHKGSLAYDQSWRKSLFVGWKKYANGVKSECWVRWTSEAGLYYWLHPTEGIWVGEPEQKTMPTFPTYEKAWTASQYCEKPRGI